MTINKNGTLNIAVASTEEPEMDSSMFYQLSMTGLTSFLMGQVLYLSIQGTKKCSIKRTKALATPMLRRTKFRLILSDA
jgi:hypothetical protein